MFPVSIVYIVWLHIRIFRITLETMKMKEVSSSIILINICPTLFIEKSPRGIPGFKLTGGNITTWKVQGKLGGYTGYVACYEPLPTAGLMYTTAILTKSAVY